jgi:hypothetical protein
MIYRPKFYYFLSYLFEKKNRTIAGVKEQLLPTPAMADFW